MKPPPDEDRIYAAMFDELLKTNPVHAVFWDDRTVEGPGADA